MPYKSPFLSLDELTKERNDELYKQTANAARVFGDAPLTYQNLVQGDQDRKMRMQQQMDAAARANEDQGFQREEIGRRRKKEDLATYAKGAIQPRSYAPETGSEGPTGQVTQPDEELVRQAAPRFKDENAVRGALATARQGEELANSKIESVKGKNEHAKSLENLAKIRQDYNDRKLTADEYNHAVQAEIARGNLYLKQTTEGRHGEEFAAKQAEGTAGGAHPLPDTENKAAIAADETLANIKAIKEKVRTGEYKTGWFAGLKQDLRNMANYRSENDANGSYLASVNDKITHDFAGSAMTANELKRVGQELASSWDKPDVFEKYLSAVERRMRERKNDIAKQFAGQPGFGWVSDRFPRMNVETGEPDMTPSAASPTRPQYVSPYGKRTQGGTVRVQSPSGHVSDYPPDVAQSLLNNGKGYRRAQ